VEERVEQVEARDEAAGKRPRAAVCGSGGVQFVRECQARVIVRGVRSLSDMDTEFTMTLANRKLDPSIETVFLMAGRRVFRTFPARSLSRSRRWRAMRNWLVSFRSGLFADLRAKIQSDSPAR